jgi:hypothetical protein
LERGIGELPGTQARDHTCDRSVFTAAVRDHSVDFWRYFLNPDQSQKAEWERAGPDAVFRFDFGDSEKLWLVLEVKWDAGQSSHDEEGNGTQLARQWLAIRVAAQDDGAHVRQAYLTLYRSNAQSGIDDTENADVTNFDCTKWLAAHPVAMTWSELSRNLAPHANQSSPTGRWALYVRDFLEVRNVKLFSGFNYVTFGLAVSSPKCNSAA